MAGKYKVKVKQPLINTGREGARFGNNKYTETNGAGIERYYPGQSAEEAEEIQVTFGQEVNGINISFLETKFGVLSGTVRAKDTNQPLEGVKVRFYSISDGSEEVSGSFSGNSMAETDKEGNWRLNELPEGEYNLKFSPPDGAKSDKNGASYGSISKYATVVVGDDTRVEASLGYAARVKGVVRIKNTEEEKPQGPRPTFRFLVLLNDNGQSSGSQFLRGTEDNDKEYVEHSFDFTDVAPGMLRFELFGNGGTGLWVNKILVGGKRVSSIDIAEGETVEDVEVFVSKDVGDLSIVCSECDRESKVALIIIPRDGSPLSFQGGPKVTETGSELKWNLKFRPGIHDLVVIKISALREFRGKRKELRRLSDSGVEVEVKVNEKTEAKVGIVNP